MATLRYGRDGGSRVAASVTLEVDALDSEPGIRIRDTAEAETVVLPTDRPVSLATADTAALDGPVDTAVAVDATELHLPTIFDPVVRRDGAVVHKGDPDGDNPRLPMDTYEIDVSPPVKLYVRVVDGEPAVRYCEDHTYLDVGDAARVVLGIRSYHERPVGTVTVSDDPRDVMAAVSSFGSALKTLSPDRSWPTLRGHPPAIERGTALDVPDAVAAPDTGVSIEVPPELGAIYTVAPLAFYLGATVEPGDQPRLVAGDRVRTFDANALAADVRDVLEHVFTLDCVVREAGIYPFRTAQTDAIETHVHLDYESLFELSLAERTAAYLDVPRVATDGVLNWHYTADVAAEPANAVALPYLVDELALVRSPPAQAHATTLTPSPDALEHELDGELARSGGESSAPLRAAIPEDPGTTGQSWLTTDLALGAANPTVGSFRRGFAWPDGEGPLDVHVVYNDARLEAGDDTAYDTHPGAETDVRRSQSLTTTELRDALHEETDFLHFVGHVTTDGMVCSDGVLDVRTLARTGVSAFFLNGCRSYEQGRALLTAGSVGGIVTVDDVADASAGRVGRALSLLLDTGFPLYAVLDALRLTNVRRDRYAVLGSGTLAFRRSPSGVPVLYEFHTDEFDADTDVLPTTAHYYPYGERSMGAFTSTTYTDQGPEITGAKAGREWLPREELARMLEASPEPVVLDGEITLTDDLSVEDFR